MGSIPAKKTSESAAAFKCRKLLKNKSYSYKGGLLNGAPHGNGRRVMDYDNNITRIYTGEFRQGLRWGKGTETMTEIIYQTRHIDTYTGDWVSDKKHGHGRHEKNGHVYDGSWVLGSRSVGKEVTTRYIYEGDWKEENFHGKGKYVCKNYTYIGQFKSGKKSGKGIFNFNNGNSYVGGFKSGKKSGKGIFNFNNGDSYVGEFKSGKKSGEGKYTFSNGTVRVGNWKDGHLHGHGTCTTDVSTYVGEWKVGKMHGHGTMKFPKTSAFKSATYDGNWANNNRSGQGTYIYDYGQYIGEWKNNLTHGKEVMKLVNGQTLDGIWESNRIVSGTIGKYTGLINPPATLKCASYELLFGTIEVCEFKQGAPLEKWDPDAVYAWIYSILKDKEMIYSMGAIIEKNIGGHELSLLDANDDNYLKIDRILLKHILKCRDQLNAPVAVVDAPAAVVDAAVIVDVPVVDAPAAVVDAAAYNI
jgi:hypothetical protein